MPTVFILEDDEVRGPALVRRFKAEGYDVTLAKSYQDGVAVLSDWPKFDVASLDHDLGLGASGYDFVQYMIKQLDEAKRPNVVFVHSANPVGAKHMLDALQDAGFVAQRTSIL